MKDKTETVSNDDIGKTGLCETCVNETECKTIGIIQCPDYERDEVKKKWISEHKDSKS